MQKFIKTVLDKLYPGCTMYASTHLYGDDTAEFFPGGGYPLFKLKSQDLLAHVV